MGGELTGDNTKSERSKEETSVGESNGLRTQAMNRPYELHNKKKVRRIVPFVLLVSNKTFLLTNKLGNLFITKTIQSN